MHMTDAFITPLVGGVMWAASLTVGRKSVNSLQQEVDDRKIPLMGVMGAFVFAAQMINFTIPFTGSSGHLGGGMLLAAVLGPHAGFLTMAAILVIQALFFADGGLLALGCNIFNLGFYTCFIAYPFIYKKILNQGFSTKRILWASLLSSVIGLQLGAFSVVLQVVLSGKTELHFAAFFALMQSIHLAIGLVEGLVTAAVISFIWRARPEALEGYGEKQMVSVVSLKTVVMTIAIAAVLIGGLLSWFVSENPDGLEWSVLNATGSDTLAATGWLHEKLLDMQSRAAVLPDYSIKNQEMQKSVTGERMSTSVAGVSGVLLTLILIAATGVALRYYKRTRNDKA